MAAAPKVVLLVLFPSLAVCFIVHPVFSSGTCIKEERDALVEFKKHLTDPGMRLSSWVGEDCCLWQGIGCDVNTGHVTQLNLRGNMSDLYNSLGGVVSSSLLCLKHLMSLDLSHNHFAGAPFPKFIGSFQQLRYLNLSSSYFCGEIPHELGNLSTLQYLDLSLFCYPDLSKTVNLPPSLIELHLDYISINVSTVTVSTNLTSLKVLRIFAVFSIPSLWLKWPKWLSGLNSLTSLVLNLGVRSTIPAWICTLGNLKHLDLRANSLEGRIPDCFANLSHLAYLDLSGNSLSGILPSNIEQLTSLEVLDLSYNHLTGSVPTSFGNLWNLKVLRLDNNNLTGSIPESLGLLSQLETLVVSYNNYLEGTVNEIHFTHLSSLLSLEMSSTSVIWNVSSDWNPPFQLTGLQLSSCTLGPHFPIWLLTQTNLEYLVISKANIEDVVPNSFWNFSAQLSYVDLSYNRLRGQLPDVFNMKYIDLSHNYFEGPVSMNFSVFAQLLDVSSNLISGFVPMDIKRYKGAPSLMDLNLSNNCITGSIPVSLCNVSYLTVLSLSMNQLSGSIPDCWPSYGYVGYVDLSRNNLVGEIPTTFGNLSGLVALYLSHNNLTGEMSSMLPKRLSVFVLDIGENKLVGRIPSRLGEKLPNLMVLRLRSNMLSGSIPPDISHIASLQVLDLAQNNISGHIPESLKNFNAMKARWNKRRERNEEMGLGNSYYEEKVMIATKGGEWEFKIIKNILCSIDLSHNNLSGEIPEGLTDLVGLINVNLSKNHLTGKIPDRIGDLQSLESLDLSQNHLHGKIPDGLSALHFLAYMNLSYNNLSGRIPQGSQVQTLDDPYIYVGNRELCGPLIRKQCQEDKTPSQPFGPGGINGKDVDDDDDDDNNQMVFLYISVAPGFIVGLWGVFVVFLFSKSWRTAYFRFVKAMEDNIIVVVLIWWAKFWKMFYKR